MQILQLKRSKGSCTLRVLNITYKAKDSNKHKNTHLEMGNIKWPVQKRSLAADFYKFYRDDSTNYLKSCNIEMTELKLFLFEN